jgi:tryptophan 2,3-dioxygenase
MMMMMNMLFLTVSAYELWFKQIIFEVDSVRSLLDVEGLDESHTMEILKRLNRIVLILKVNIHHYPYPTITYPYPTKWGR